MARHLCRYCSEDCDCYGTNYYDCEGCRYCHEYEDDDYDDWGV